MWKVSIPAGTEYIFLILLNILEDPNISYHIACLTTNAYINDPQHKEWHTSLRVNPSSRWVNIKNLHSKKHFQKMPGIPINFPLPYDSNKWRKYKIIMTQLLFFREGFMRIETVGVERRYRDHRQRNMKYSEIIDNIDSLNHMNHPDKEILEAYGDFILFSEDEKDADSDWIPYMLKEIGHEGMRIIN
jgi:hypothetical protein